MSLVKNYFLWLLLSVSKMLWYLLIGTCQNFQRYGSLSLHIRSTTYAIGVVSLEWPLTVLGQWPSGLVACPSPALQSIICPVYLVIREYQSCKLTSRLYRSILVALGLLWRSGRTLAAFVGMILCPCHPSVIA